MRKARPLLLITLIDIISYLIYVVRVIVIVQFVLSLLISFNIVNTSNDFVAGLWRGINILLEPLLRPIRRIMPDTGSIDFSPLILIVVLVIIGDIILPNVRTSLIVNMAG